MEVIEENGWRKKKGQEVRGGKCMTPSSGRNTTFINETDDLSRSVCVRFSVLILTKY